MQEKDTEILNQLRLKNESFFEVFYKEYFKRLYILAYQYTKNEGHAEEIVHDVFLKIWHEADTLNIQHSLGSYLSRCVVNASLNWLKKEKQEMNRLLDYTENVKDENDFPDEAELLENQLLLIEKALNTLPPQCKKVMMMSKFDKCKQQDIADTLNISIKTVKNHLTYGFNKMRIMLSAENLLLCVILFHKF